MKRCLVCGENPDNYKGKNDFICSPCTDARVNFVAMVEKETKKELLKSRGRKGKKKDEPLGIIRNAKDYNLAYSIWKTSEERKAEKTAHEDLTKTRKERGLSREFLAAYLGCTKNFLWKMEAGRKPLNQKALEFIKAGLKFPKKKRKKKNDETV